MSTSAVISSNTAATLPIKTETVNFAVVGTVVDGKLTKIRHTSTVNDINALKGIDKDGKPAPYTGAEEIVLEQAVTRASLGSLAGFEELIPDPDVRLDIINKGLASKFSQKIKTLLTEQAEDTSLVFQPADTPYDATPLLQEPSQRTSMSVEEKMLKTLGNLPDSVKASIMATIKAQLEAAAAGSSS